MSYTCFLLLGGWHDGKQRCSLLPDSWFCFSFDFSVALHSPACLSSELTGAGRLSPSHSVDVFRLLDVSHFSWADFGQHLCLRCADSRWFLSLLFCSTYARLLWINHLYQAEVNPQSAFQRSVSIRNFRKCCQCHFQKRLIYYWETLIVCSFITSCIVIQRNGI